MSAVATETEMANLPETASNEPRETPASEEEQPQSADLEEAPSDSDCHAKDDDDDDVTIIMLDQTIRRGSANDDAFAWINASSPEMEERRRAVLVQELRRVQRASFLHFLLLCLIPTAFLVIVIATVMGDTEDCASDTTFCALEPRTFMNAFTTRCVCDAIPIEEGN